MSCKHERVLLNVSEYGVRQGFETAKDEKVVASLHPAPLVLPGDALTDPEELYPQTFNECVEDEDRNELTSSRRTIYLVRPPSIDASVSFMRDWTQPATVNRSRTAASGVLYERLRDYVAAFYHGMPVKLYDRDIKFTRHGTGKSETPAKIDVLFGDGLLLEVRTRACPDKVFARQLNLNDLLDVLINVLPEDAYAMMMLVDHDIHEGDEIFQCGRAYGASRVAVVSSARYNPVLDPTIGLELEHAWPASHCLDYITSFISEHEESRPTKRKKQTRVASTKDGLSQPGALHDAVAVYRDTLATLDLKDELVMQRLWLSRVCRTVTHELGHCIGIDHCIYYACLMQATSGLLEDARQPLYLCPVDERKLLQTVKTGSQARDAAMLELLRSSDWDTDPTFAAYRLWLAQRAASGTS